MIDSPVSLTVPLTEANGTTIEGIIDEDGLGYSVIDLSNEIPTIVEAMLVGEVLEYSVVDGVRGIEDSTVTLDSDVIEGKIDNARDSVAIMVTVVSIIDSVLVIVFPTAVSVSTFGDVEYIGDGF